MESIIVYRSFVDAIRRLPPDQQLAMWDIIIDYGFTLQTPESLDNMQSIIFTLIKPQIDANFEKRTAAKRGGAPKGNKNAQKTAPSCGNPVDNLEVSFKNSVIDGCLKNNHRLNEKQLNANANANANVNVNANAVSFKNNENNSNEQTAVFLKENINNELEKAGIKLSKSYFIKLISIMEQDSLDVQFIAFCLQQLEEREFSGKKWKELSKMSQRNLFFKAATEWEDFREDYRTIKKQRPNKCPLCGKKLDALGKCTCGAYLAMSGGKWRTYLNEEE